MIGLTGKAKCFTALKFRKKDASSAYWVAPTAVSVTMNKRASNQQGAANTSCAINVAAARTRLTSSKGKKHPLQQVKHKSAAEQSAGFRWIGFNGVLQHIFVNKHTKSLIKIQAQAAS